MNKLLFKAPVDENGNTEQLVIDTEKKEYSRGCFLFIGGGVRVETKQMLNELEYQLKENDFKEVK